MNNVIAIVLFGCIAPISIIGQCVRDDVITANLRGADTDSQTKQPIPGADVSVWKGHSSEGKLIGHITTDVKGGFNLPKLKSGRYTLSITFPHLDRIVTRLTISKRSNKSGFLQVLLAPPDLSGTDSCEGTITVITTDSDH